MPSILDTNALLSRWIIYLMRQTVAGLPRKLMAEDVKKTSLHQDVAETQIGSLPAGNHICNSGFQLLFKGIRGTFWDGTFACLVTEVRRAW